MTIPTGSLKRTADQLSLLTNSDSLYTQKLETSFPKYLPSDKMDKISNTNYLKDSESIEERSKSFDELRLDCFNLVKLINIFETQLNRPNDKKNQNFHEILELSKTCSEEMKYMLIENTYKMLKDDMEKLEKQCEALTCNKRLKV